MERNEFLEGDGLFWESDTHEWFNQKTMTVDAHKKGLKNLYAFVVRNKGNGEYDYVLMDKRTNKVVYETKNLEQIGCHIDMLGFAKQIK